MIKDLFDALCVFPFRCNQNTLGGPKLLEKKTHTKKINLEILFDPILGKHTVDLPMHSIRQQSLTTLY